MAKNDLTAQYLAALDVGSSKIACLIAQVLDDGSLEVKGYGYHKSNGVKNAQIADLDTAKNDIAKAIDAAESMIGTNIDKVIVNATCNQLSSLNFAAESKISGHQITDNEVKRLIDRCATSFNIQDHQIIHCIPTGYSVDNIDQIKDPRAMYCAERLGVHLHILSANKWMLKNIETILGDINIGVAATVAGPYASGLSCLSESEKDLGAILIDMGAGTTSTSVFLNGQMLHAATIPVGGFNVTKDIAQYFTTSLPQAERLKTINGSAFITSSDGDETISVPMLDEYEYLSDDTTSFKRSELNKVIHMRIQEIFELVKDHLKENNLYDLPSRRVVLTGGGCQLQGAKEVAAEILERSVRIGKPLNINGLPEKFSGSEFSTCCGLMCFGLDNPSVVLNKKMFNFKKSKFLKWFLNNF